MTESNLEISGPSPELSSKLTGALVFIAVLGAISVFSAVKERISDQEAHFLNQVIDSSESSSLPVLIQSAWADAVGLMERPSRLLGLLSGFTGLLLLLSTLIRGSRHILTGLALAVACGCLFAEMIQIGGNAPAFLLLILILKVVQLVSGANLRVLAYFGFLCLAGVQFLNLRQAGQPFNLESWFSFGPDLTIWGLPAFGGLAVTAAFIFLALLWNRELVGICCLLLACGAGFLANKLGYQALPIGWIMSAFAAPIALLLASPKNVRSQSWLVPMSALILALLTMITVAQEARLATPSTTEKAQLDWIANNMPLSAWLIIDGERQNVIRYYQRSGHLTGHRALLVDQNAPKIRALVSLNKPPLVAFIDADEAVKKPLLDRYAIVEQKDAPKGVTSLRFKGQK